MICLGIHIFVFVPSPVSVRAAVDPLAQSLARGVGKDPAAIGMALVRRLAITTGDRYIDPERTGCSMRGPHIDPWWKFLLHFRTGISRRKHAERVRGIDHTIIGDASEFDVLIKAGLRDAATVIVTTHDDDVNIFLTIFYRRLRSGMQIISRYTEEATAPRLHRAGADLVLSYASMGANTIFNHLRGSGTVLLAEGVNI